MSISLWPSNNNKWWRWVSYY